MTHQSSAVIDTETDLCLSDDDDAPSMQGGDTHVGLTSHAFLATLTGSVELGSETWPTIIEANVRGGVIP